MVLNIDHCFMFTFRILHFHVTPCHCFMLLYSFLPPTSATPMEHPWQDLQGDEYPSYIPHVNLVQNWDEPDSTSLPPPYPRAPLVQPVTQSPHPAIPLRPPVAAARDLSGKKGSRKFPQRGRSYTQAEDKALCSAYLNVSRDPIVGANQTSDTYWDRI